MTCITYAFSGSDISILSMQITGDINICVLSHSVMSNCYNSPLTVASRLPCPWDLLGRILAISYSVFSPGRLNPQFSFIFCICEWSLTTKCYLDSVIFASKPLRILILMHQRDFQSLQLKLLKAHALCLFLEHRYDIHLSDCLFLSLVVIL